VLSVMASSLRAVGWLHDATAPPKADPGLQL
jgi:hypothetical protein